MQWYMMMENTGKTHTPKFEGEDIRIGFRSTTELPNYQCRYSLDVALDCIDRFSYLRNYNQRKDCNENIEPEHLDRSLKR